MAKTEFDKLTFEEALKQLEDIVGRLESGRVELEESISIYERGAALKAHCERKLKDAEARIKAAEAERDRVVKASPVAAQMVARPADRV